MKNLDIAIVIVVLVIIGIAIYFLVKPVEKNNVPCAEGWERTKTTCIKVK